MSAISKIVKFEDLAVAENHKETTRVRMVDSEYFEVPNAVVDNLAIMPDSTWKIYGIIIRKTYGWNKEFDAISISQLEAISGQTDKTITKNCGLLVDSGLIVFVGLGVRDTKIYQPNKLTTDLIRQASEYFRSYRKKSDTRKNSDTSIGEIPTVLSEKFRTQKKTPQKKIKETIVAPMSDDTVAATALAVTEPSKPVAKKAKPVDHEKRAANIATRQAYFAAYKHRYGVEPVLNAKLNGQIAKFVSYVGAEDAPHIAAHYVADNHFFYVQKGHDFGLLLTDCQKLRQQWMTGNRITQVQAQQADKTQSRMSVYEEVKRAIDAGEI